FLFYVAQRALHSFPTRRLFRSRHLHGVLVLGGQGAAAQRTDDGRHDSNRPQAFALHNRFLLCEDELLSSPLSSRARRSLLRRRRDRKSTRLNSSHVKISYAVFC